MRAVLKKAMLIPTTKIAFGLLSVLLSISTASGTQGELEEVLISVSIDYEGEKIKSENIEAMISFRKKHPNVRFIHFLNAASFTVDGADAEETKRLLRKVINPKIDEIGLHIHPRKSLVEASNVKFRAVPTYLGDTDPSYVIQSQQSGLMPWDAAPKTEPSMGGKFGEAGNDVPFWAYSEAEQRKMIRTSIDILAAQGFKGIKSFRAGGWSASPATWRALAAEGLTIDSSAVPAEIISALYSKSYLMHFNKQIWKGVTSSSQPYKVDLGGTTAFMQFPNNGGLADYQSPEDFFQSFIDTINANANQRRAIIHIGFHLESAAQYLHNVSGGYDLMQEYAKKNGLTLTPATFQSSLKLAKASKPERFGYLDFSGTGACTDVFK